MLPPPPEICFHIDQAVQVVQYKFCFEICCNYFLPSSHLLPPPLVPNYSVPIFLNPCIRSTSLHSFSFQSLRSNAPFLLFFLFFPVFPVFFSLSTAIFRRHTYKIEAFRYTSFNLCNVRETPGTQVPPLPHPLHLPAGVTKHVRAHPGRQLASKCNRHSERKARQMVSTGRQDPPESSWKPCRKLPIAK